MGAMIPFIVLTTIRSGSTHLIRMLNDHPNVVANGEVCNADDPDYSWGKPPARTTEEVVQMAFEDFPFGTHNHRDVEAVGCKLEDLTLFSEQGRLPKLMAVPHMRFIVLQRRNQFETLRSLLQASARGVWQLQSGQQITPLPPVTVSPLMARAFFERAEVFYGRVSLLVPPEQRIWIDYEQLRAHTDMIMDHCWKFLGVDPHTCTPQLAKIEERPLRDTVANYGELQLLFEGTDYAGFLP